MDWNSSSFDHDGDGGTDPIDNTIFRDSYNSVVDPDLVSNGPNTASINNILDAIPSIKAAPTSSTTTLNPVECSQHFCNIVGTSRSCCSGQPAPTNTSVQAGMEAWSSYCKSSCTGLAGGNPQRDRIRRVITGTASSDPLPLSCGGSSTNSGGTVDVY